MYVCIYVYTHICRHNIVIYIYTFISSGQRISLMNKKRLTELVDLMGEDAFTWMRTTIAEEHKELPLMAGALQQLVYMKSLLRL